LRKTEITNRVSTAEKRPANRLRFAAIKVVMSSKAVILYCSNRFCDCLLHNRFLFIERQPSGTIGQH
jgi:hypothetical protein